MSEIAQSLSCHVMSTKYNLCLHLVFLCGHIQVLTKTSLKNFMMKFLFIFYTMDVLYNCSPVFIMIPNLLTIIIPKIINSHQLLKLGPLCMKLWKNIGQNWNPSPSCYIIGIDLHARNIHVALYGYVKLKFHKNNNYFN